MFFCAGDILVILGMMVGDGWEPMNKSENPWLSQVVGGGTISGCFWRTTPMVSWFSYYDDDSQEKSSAVCL